MIKPHQYQQYADRDRRIKACLTACDVPVTERGTVFSQTSIPIAYTDKCLKIVPKDYISPQKRKVIIDLINGDFESYIRQIEDRKLEIFYRLLTEGK